MSAVTYLTTEKEWSRALDEAKSLDTLRAVVAGWMPYVPDAVAVVDKMGEFEFRAWREGLALERKGQWAGAAHSESFGELLMPTILMQASQLASQFGVPLGAMLLRMRELKAVR